MKPKKLLSLALAMVMTISLLPIFTITASATTTTEKNITLGTSALKGGQKSNIYFGTYQQSSLGNTKPTTGTEGVDWIKSTTATKNDQGAYYSKDPIKWRVLSNSDEKAFLLSDKNLDVVRYHEDKESVTWETSTIRSWLNGYNGASNQKNVDYSNDNFINSAFNATEKTAVTDGNTTDKVFLLSVAEAQNTAYGFTDDTNAAAARIAVNTAYTYGGGRTKYNLMYGIGKADYWLLRSSGSDAKKSAIVKDDGALDINGDDVGNDSYAVRPAFNLDASSVLFTVPAADGKSDIVGLQKTTEYTGTDYKLTIKDSARSAFNANTTAISGNEVSISYENAKKGANEYISAMIINADGEITYYGRLVNVESESGNVVLDLTNITIAATDKLYIFNEQINGDYKTDYASVLKEIEIETKIVLTNDRVSAYFVGNDGAVLIVASYRDEALKDVKIIPVELGMYTKTLAEIGLDITDADSIKAFLWTDLTTMTSLCAAREVRKGF